MGDLQIHDSVLTLDINNSLLNEVLCSGGFKYGERDSVGTPVSGMVLELPSYLEDFFVGICLETNPRLAGAVLQRAYANLFIPHERPMFHVDGNVVTNLFYLCGECSHDEGGETQFIDRQGHIFGVLPKPGRMVVFDGMTQHRATAFRTLPRVTVAIKFFTNGC